MTEIPYFEGDFWPNVLEENIKELDQEAKEREAEGSIEVSYREPYTMDNLLLLQIMM